MLLVIIGRSRDDAPWETKPAPYGGSWDTFHRQNDSEPGPKGMLRHRIGSFCVGHGSGTWDLCLGEFS
jgi:hypothetical protein